MFRLPPLSRLCLVLVFGNALAETPPAPPCRTDPATGLAWEITGDDAQRRQAWRYRRAGGAGDLCGSGPCDADTYLAALNRLDNGPDRPPGLCGRQDWRLPVRAELESLVDRRYLKPAADPDRQPGLEADIYWTASDLADDGQLGWAVDFDRGLVTALDKTSHQRLQAVAGPVPASTACADAGRGFAATADGSVAQAGSRLVWARCAAGQEWDGRSCRGEPQRLAWPDLQPPAGGWRLPSAAELSALVAVACGAPAIAADAFPATPPGRFWSATPAAGYPGFAWTVDFSDGSVGVDVRRFGNYVRWVREAP